MRSDRKRHAIDSRAKLAFDFQTVRTGFVLLLKFSSVVLVIFKGVINLLMNKPLLRGILVLIIA
ncbi:MAG: hypothetical protein ACKVLF_05030, partial [Nitrospinaceae bacterium]